jgi:hypothetical protein
MTEPNNSKLTQEFKWYYISSDLFQMNHETVVMNHVLESEFKLLHYQFERRLSRK